MVKSKTYHRRKNYKSRKNLTRRKQRKNNRKKTAIKRGGGSGNPFGIDQFNTPLTYSGNAGWYGQYPRASDQILYKDQAQKMSYTKNLILANEPIPGVNIAMTSPLSQKGGSKIPLYRQDSTIIGDSELSDFYPGPGHY